MKKFLILLVATATMVTCSDKDEEPQQDYTSFAITLKTTTPITNVVSAYRDENGYYHTIATHGNLSTNQSTSEVILNFNVDTIHIFADTNWPIRFYPPFAPIKNKKNIFEITADLYGAHVSKSDSLQYPH